MKTVFFRLLTVTLFVISCCRTWAGDDYHLHEFTRQQLTDIYYSEGVNVGDVNRDGITDVIHGPYWFAGPRYKSRQEIYPAKAQPRERYANNFFSWLYDFNGDGWNDVFTVGFPGTPAHVYENPTKGGLSQHWPKHEVFDWVSNESPHFTNLVGDDRPELVCTRDGYFGYATVNWKQPFDRWTFHIVSEQVASKRFGHGLGVGDIDGDGRLDIITKDGWFQQPRSIDKDPKWTFHKVPFARPGGAEMYAYDVDGDGDNDVITSLSAHNFGLAWHEQLNDDGKISFRQHLIMGSRPEQNRYGLVFSEPHSVNLFDMDGDGLKDIVTGKTYWSHHTKSPMWDAGAVVYWFKLARGEKRVDWIPYKADGESGIGRQLIVGDINGDQLPDIVVGGMKGCHVLFHERKTVDKKQWKDTQPRPRTESTTQSAAESSRTVRVAGIVLKWLRAEKEQNYQRAEQMIRRAAQGGAKIVCTTECFLDGYAIKDKTIPLDDYRALGEPIPSGKYFKRLAALADELDIFLVAGMLEADGEYRYNTAVLINTSGRLVGRYRKQQLGHESVRNTPGDESPVFETPYGRVGMMICADRRYPDLVKEICTGGADFLICPSGGMFGSSRNDPIVQSRSKENRIHIVFVHPAEFLVTDPQGEMPSRTILGDRLEVTKEQVGTELDKNEVFFFDLPSRNSTES